MEELGHDWDVSTSEEFSLDLLLEYDAVFVGGPSVDNSVLIDYVNQGGNVYLAGATGLGGAVSEAARWNEFLGEFGLEFESAYNGITGVIAVFDSPHPVFEGVEIFQDNGQTIIDLDPNDRRGAIVARQDELGLFAIYDSREATTEETYRYDVVAVDPDNDPVSYTHLTLPTNREV